VASRIYWQSENLCILYRKQKVSGKGSSVLMACPYEVVSTLGLNHRANRREARGHRPWKGPYCVQGRTGKIVSSTLKMEAICSSETSVATQQTTRRHIPEDDTLHNYRCENLKSSSYSTRAYPLVVPSNSGTYFVSSVFISGERY
jgi:hypothetical protein